MKTINIVLAMICIAEASANDASSLTEINRKILQNQANPTAYKGVETINPDQIPNSEHKIKPLSERVTFLSDGTASVMIPKGAVIHLPEKGRITLETHVKGEWVEWEAFFHRNRNAIRLETVSYKQLQGEETIQEDVYDKIKKEKVPVITSYNSQIVAMPALYLNTKSP